MTLTLFGRRVTLTSPVQIRKARPCGACADRGWFYTIGATGPDAITPPDGCSGVALCSCAAAALRARDIRRSHRRLYRQTRFYSRMGWQRRLLLALSFGRIGAGQPPF